jgi:hypothetical protein
LTAASEPAHSPYGPSSAERWLNCPASIRATRGMPDTDSDWSTEGTAGHTLSEWARLEDKPTSYWLGEKIQVEQVDGTTVEVKVDSEMVTAIQEFVDYVNQFDGEHHVEVRVYYKEYVPDGFGTLDHATLAAMIARITDLKYGKGVQVFAEWNEQLLCYALGVLLEWDWLYGFKKFILTIHQPRLDHVDTWEISREDLLKWAKEVLIPGYKRTLDPKAEFNPGEWCQFCKIKATCRARTEHKFRLLQSEFTNLNELKPSNPDVLENDDLAAVRKHFKEIKAWMAAIDSHIFSELRKGHACGDLKIVDGRSSRVLVGEQKDLVRDFAKHGVSKAELYEEPSLKSPHALEKEVKGLAPLLKPKTDKKPAGALAKYVQVVKGKPTIVGGDDPRPAISLRAEDEFSNLNEGDFE